jgi:hypothetical protein
MQRSRYFVAYDQASDGGRGDHTDRLPACQSFDCRRQPASQFLGMPRMLEHQRALQILCAVETAGEPEVAGEIGAGGAKEIENAHVWLRLRHRKRLL